MRIRNKDLEKEKKGRKNRQTFLSCVNGCCPLGDCFFPISRLILEDGIDLLPSLSVSISKFCCFEEARNVSLFSLLIVE